MTSIKDVARLANVSVGSVSRFLNDPSRLRESTRSRIAAAVSATDYAPSSLARNFRLGRTGLVVVVVSAIGDPFLGDVLTGITRVARDHGLTVQVKEANINRVRPSDVNDLVFSRQADGIILLGGPSPYDLSQDLNARVDHPPIVLAGEMVSPELHRFPSVQINNFAAACEMTRFVLSYGHKHLAFMRGEPNSTTTDDREKGFRHAVLEHGIDVGEDRFVFGNMTVIDGRRATRQLLNLDPRPTAIVCASDEMAIGVMAEIRANGLVVPDDISVVGFDDIRYSDVVHPRLTTVSQPAEVMGENSMYRLLKAMRDPTIVAGIDILPHQIIVRESVTNPPKGAERPCRNS